MLFAINVYNLHLGKPKFECIDCNKVSDSIKSLKVHIFSQHIGYTIECPYCSHVVRSKMSLYNHIKRLHPNKKLSCFRCAYTTFLPTSLDEHLHKVHRESQQTQDVASKTQIESEDNDYEKTVNFDDQEVENKKKTEEMVREAALKKLTKIFHQQGKNIKKLLHFFINNLFIVLFRKNDL